MCQEIIVWEYDLLFKTLWEWKKHLHSFSVLPQIQSLGGRPDLDGLSFEMDKFYHSDGNYVKVSVFDENIRNRW